MKVIFNKNKEKSKEKSNKKDLKKVKVTFMKKVVGNCIKKIV